MMVRAASIALACFLLGGCDKKSATKEEPKPPATPDASPAAAVPPVELGRMIYEKKGCISCHTIDGSKKVGAPLNGLWGTTITITDGSTAVVDAAFLRKALDDPKPYGQPGYPPTMPSYSGQLSDAEIEGLAAFLASIR